MTYGKPSKLLVRNRNPIRSERGVQQGDPLGPFLFALALQPALVKAAEGGCCVMAYLDDVYVCGHQEDVVHAIEELLSVTAKIGLTSNMDKCWATKRLSVNGKQLGLKIRPTVLGAPLNPDEELPTDIVPEELMKKVVDLPDLQIALHLLRFIHNSRFTNLFRLSSPAASEALARKMMEVTRRSLTSMLEEKSLPDYVWQQAVLPAGSGVGFMDLIQMAPFMAHASILEAVVRLAQTDPNRFGDFMTESHWETIKGSPIYACYTRAMRANRYAQDNDVRYAKLQNFFATHVVIPRAYEAFFADKNVPDTAKAIVKSAADSPIAKLFFAAIPTKKELSLNSTEMRLALRILLGVSPEMKAKKCECKSDKDLDIFHALSCKIGGGSIRRHDSVKDVFGEILKLARLSYEMEPTQALRGNKLRPDFIVRYGYDGHDIAFDLTIESPVSSNPVPKVAINDDQKFLMQAARTKILKYQEECEKNNTSFVPIVLSAFGGVLQESYTCGIKFLIHKIRKTQFISPNWAASTRKAYWLQRIAIALWLGNVRQVSSFIKKAPVKQY